MVDLTSAEDSFGPPERVARRDPLRAAISARAWRPTYSSAIGSFSPKMCTTNKRCRTYLTSCEITDAGLIRFDSFPIRDVATPHSRARSDYSRATN